jgi:hypothetical protein
MIPKSCRLFGLDHAPYLITSRTTKPRAISTFMDKLWVLNFRRCVFGLAKKKAPAGL